MVKIRVVGTLSIVLSLLLSACSQSGSYSSGSDSSVSECQSLADQYWSEYQAYKDARAANNNVEDETVMSHYYASSDYYLQFMNLDCESQGYSLEGDGSSSSDSDIADSESDYSEPQIVLDILDRLTSVSSESWSIDQAITIEESMHFYTAAVAQQLFREKDYGTIEIGKVADLIILDRNPLEVEPHEVCKIKLLATYRRGIKQLLS
jgi:hypothetical protein